MSGEKWDKKTKDSQHRGFVNDNQNLPDVLHCTKKQNVNMLVVEMLLGQIANYTPIISRNTIVKNSTSIESTWQAIRLHYGFQTSGSNFLDFTGIKLQSDEHPEDLYQCIVAFIEDILLKPDIGISHHGQDVQEEED